MDDNDKLRAGELSPNPLEGCEPVDLPEVTPDAAVEPVEARSLAALLEHMMPRLKSRLFGLDVPIKTPWDSVNDAIAGGLWPGELSVLSGGTGSGKTQWALQVALAAAKAGNPVLYVALEMSELDALCRLAAMLSPGAHWSALWRGNAPSDAAGDALVALNDAETNDDPPKPKVPLPLHFEFGKPGQWSADALDALVDSLPVIPDRRPLVIVDYIQLAGAPENQRLDARERVGTAAYACREVARNRDVAMLVVSSVSRANGDAIANYATASSREPSSLVGVGKEAGELEFAAGLALVIVPGKKPKPGVLVVAKARAAVPVDVVLSFDGGRFDEPMPKGGGFHD